MNYEWDEEKRQRNIQRRGIDFVDIPAVFDGEIVVMEDDRYDYGEVRWVAFGILQGRGWQTKINLLLRAYMEEDQKHRLGAQQ